MVDGFELSGELVNDLYDVIRQSRELAEDVPENIPNETAELMYVRLTEEGELLGSEDGITPFPYKAEVIQQDGDTHGWIPVTPPFNFQGIGFTPVDSENIDLYVYELNGLQGLVGEIYPINLMGYSSGTAGTIYWGFNARTKKNKVLPTKDLKDGKYEGHDMIQRQDGTWIQDPNGNEYRENPTSVQKPVLQEVNQLFGGQGRLVDVCVNLSESTSPGSNDEKTIYNIDFGGSLTGRAILTGNAGDGTYPSTQVDGGGMVWPTGGAFMQEASLRKDIPDVVHGVEPTLALEGVKHVDFTIYWDENTKSVKTVFTWSRPNLENAEVDSETGQTAATVYQPLIDAGPSDTVNHINRNNSKFRFNNLHPTDGADEIQCKVTFNEIDDDNTEIIVKAPDSGEPGTNTKPGDPSGPVNIINNTINNVVINLCQKIADLEKKQIDCCETERGEVILTGSCTGNIGTVTVDGVILCFVVDPGHALPAGVTVNPGTGVITYAPAAGQRLNSITIWIIYFPCAEVSADFEPVPETINLIEPCEDADETNDDDGGYDQDQDEEEEPPFKPVENIIIRPDEAFIIDPTDEECQETVSPDDDGTVGGGGLECCSVQYRNWNFTVNLRNARVPFVDSSPIVKCQVCFKVYLKRLRTNETAFRPVTFDVFSCSGCVDAEMSPVGFLDLGEGVGSSTTIDCGGKPIRLDVKGSGSESNPYVAKISLTGASQIFIGGNVTSGGSRIPIAGFDDESNMSVEVVCATSFLPVGDSLVIGQGDIVVNGAPPCSGKIVFTITGGADAALFEINDEGEVRIKDGIDTSGQASYTIELTGTDDCGTTHPQTVILSRDSKPVKPVAQSKKL